MLCSRSMLSRLVDGTLTEGQEAVPCRPGQPFYVEGRPDRLTALFPVYLRGTSDDALITAFAQVTLLACIFLRKQRMLTRNVSVVYRLSCADVTGICRGAPPYWQQQWPSDYLHTSRGTALVHPRFWPCKPCNVANQKIVGMR